MWIKGWFVILSVNGLGTGSIGYLLLEPIRNIQLSVELPAERALGLASGGYAFEEEQYVRLAGWADCSETQSPGKARIFLCTISKEKLKELPCRANEGMWVNGIQYC